MSTSLPSCCLLSAGLASASSRHFILPSLASLACRGSHWCSAPYGLSSIWQDLCCPIEILLPWFKSCHFYAILFDSPSHCLLLHLILLFCWSLPVLLLSACKVMGFLQSFHTGFGLVLFIWVFIYSGVCPLYVGCQLVEGSTEQLVYCFCLRLIIGTTCPVLSMCCSQTGTLSYTCCDASHCPWIWQLCAWPHPWPWLGTPWLLASQSHSLPCMLPSPGTAGYLVWCPE